MRNLLTRVTAIVISQGGCWCHSAKLESLLPVMSRYNKRAVKADPRTETGLSECPFILYTESELVKKKNIFETEYRSVAQVGLLLTI